MILDYSGPEADVHYETYVAMLQSALNQHGDKTHFAQQTQRINRGYISSIITGARHLSPQKAEEIAAFLPWSPETRHAFVEHVLLHREARLRQQAAIQRAARDYAPAELIRQMHLELAALMPGSNAKHAQSRYRIIRDGCIEVLHRVRPHQAPLDFTDICLLLCNVQGVLNRPDDALFYSRAVWYLLAELDPRQFQSERARYDVQLINTIRAQASAYHIMDLAAHSFSKSDEALNQLRALQIRPDLSEIHLYVTQMRAASKMTRHEMRTALHRPLGIRVIREIADDAYKACDKLDYEHVYQEQRFNIDRALGEAETRYGSMERAECLLQPLIEQSVAVPSVSLVLRAGVMRSYAHHQLAKGDTSGCVETLNSTFQLTRTAGLVHQIQRNMKQFGSLADTMLRELGDGS